MRIVKQQLYAFINKSLTRTIQRNEYYRFILFEKKI